MAFVLHQRLACRTCDLEISIDQVCFVFIVFAVALVGSKFHGFDVLTKLSNFTIFCNMFSRNQNFGKIR